jgi:hypothetical protein
MVESVFGVSHNRDHLHASEPVLYVGEVVETLELAGLVDYRQMTRILCLVRFPDRKNLMASTLENDRKWARYSLEEVAGASQAVRLLREQHGSVSGPFPVRLRKLGAACQKIHRSGFPFPLVQTDMAWDSSSGSFIFHFDGFIVDAETGQSRLDQAMTSIEQRIALTQRQRNRIHIATQHAKSSLLFKEEPGTSVQASILRPSTGPSMNATPVFK